uniref:Uncharacterized protein n=1 Tax=Anguilla anguilla TaxID=7936 RepID=A0A0E9PDQ8_ANGAN
MNKCGSKSYSWYKTTARNAGATVCNSAMLN